MWSDEASARKLDLDDDRGGCYQNRVSGDHRHREPAVRAQNFAHRVPVRFCAGPVKQGTATLSLASGFASFSKTDRAYVIRTTGDGVKGIPETRRVAEVYWP